MTAHSIKVLRMVETRAGFSSEATLGEMLHYAHSLAVNSYADNPGSILSIEVDGVTYSIEEIRRIIHADVSDHR